MTDIGGSLGISSDAFGINDLGQVVGRSYYGSAGGLHGFIYANGTATDLNTLIDPESGWIIYEGSDINNAGQIAAYGYKPGFGTQALRLDPITSAVPEPAGAGMLLAGAALLGLSRRRLAFSREGAAGRGKEPVATYRRGVRRAAKNVFVFPMF
jgi:probable HAF family extracellular repeat protein